VIIVGPGDGGASGTGSSAPNACPRVFPADSSRGAAALAFGGGPFSWSNIIRLRKTSEGFTISDDDRGQGFESSEVEGATISDSQRGKSGPAMVPTVSCW